MACRASPPTGWERDVVERSLGTLGCIQHARADSSWTDGYLRITTGLPLLSPHVACCELSRREGLPRLSCPFAHSWRAPARSRSITLEGKAQLGQHAGR